MLNFSRIIFVLFTFRYDVRGHLYSESEFGLRKNDTDVDVEEAKLEEELDKERFMFLTVDELEFEAYLGKFVSTEHTTNICKHIVDT